MGYAPQDDLAEMNPELARLHLHEVSTNAMSDPKQSGLREDV